MRPLHLGFIVLLLASSLLAFAGCRIEFAARSVVREDGSLERTTTYRAQENADKEELINRYEMPPGGEWKDSPMSVFKFLNKDNVGAVLATYEAKQVIPPGKRVLTDFKRLNRAKDRAAMNEVQVRVKDWWFVRDYRYEEKFQDILEIDKIQLVVQKVLDKGLTTFRTELNTRIQNPTLVDQVIQKVKVKYESLLSRFYGLVSEQGWDFKGVETLGDEIQKEFNAEAASKFLTAEFPELDNTANRSQIAEAFHATEKVLNDYLSEDPEIQKYGDVIFGAHGFPIFQSYDFTIQLSMPGRLLGTNADENQDGMLGWKFDNFKLNRTLTAHSRLIYRQRIIFACLAAIALLTFSLFRPRPKPPRKSRKG